MNCSLENVRLVRNLTGRFGSKLVNEILRLRPAFGDKTDNELCARYADIRIGLSENNLHRRQILNVLVEVMAMGAVALKRTTGLDAYDVQILAGASLAQGSIVEMQTGEGKTLTTLFPIVFLALPSKGVHVATVNAYLAERDFEFLKPALELLGISVGLSVSGDPENQKRTAYQCDVTFSTGYELGFDFLRDQVLLRAQNSGRLGCKLRRSLKSTDDRLLGLIQRGFASAIIDEVDSVLIDEAVTPLVLSTTGSAEPANGSMFELANTIANDLIEGEEYVVDKRENFVALTPQGVEQIHHFWAAARMSDTATKLSRPWRQYVESALRANHLMISDVNYVVRDDKVEIVDEYTGRIFSDRNWRDGLHQAVECKEGVTITAERHTAARISRQRYFQRYDLLCGMTGTAAGHEREFFKCYELPIAAIPPRKPSQRKVLPTRYFRSAKEKLSAVVDEAQQKSSDGQPVLIGTRTIAQSLQLSSEMESVGLDHQVLNGVQDEEEACLIAGAGKRGVVTVATNMAGRGTDISPDRAALNSGGLHVIGFERNTSARIDRQLIGRAGRQGDPGSGQFFVSAEDDLIVRFDPGFSTILTKINNDLGVMNPGFDRRIARIQEKAEQASYQMRMSVMQEELWLNKVKKAAG